MDLDDTLRTAPRFLPSGPPVRAVQLAAARQWHTGNGAVLTAAAGDWLLDDGQSTWTVAAAVFPRSYRALPDGTWVRSAPVQAVRVAERVEVPTLEGPAIAGPGDWLLRGTDGELWPVTDDRFRSHYAPELPADDDVSRSTPN